MPAQIVRSDFDELEKAAKTFASNAQELNRAVSKVQKSVDELEAGGWVGQAADKFYREMAQDVMPSLNRLTRAMQSAARTTALIIKLFKGVEAEWIRLFRHVGLGGVLGAGAGGAAGAGGGAGAVAAAVPAWQQANPLLVRDPTGLFTTGYMDGLIGRHFQGEGEQLGNIMDGLLSDPSPEQEDALLQDLADLRGRPVIEIRAEFDKFKELKEEQQPPDMVDRAAGGMARSNLGSNTHMRFGSVVGDAFGIDPAFGAMLSPSGGLVGYGPIGKDMDDTAVGYHGVVHDAAGYLYNNHGKVGPGYDYLGKEGRDTADALSGQRAGIAHWRTRVGSDPASVGAEYLMRGAVGGLDKGSELVNDIGSFF